MLVGNSGGEFGVRGWLTALDAGDRADRLARLQHRARRGRADRRRASSRSTRRTAARTSASRPGRRDAWKIGGGTVWGWISYDPELDLIYLRHRQSRARGTRSSGRATTSGRPASSRATPTPARRVWFYQWSPHDLYDYDGVNENVLLDLPIGGADAQGAAAPRAQRLPLRARPRDRRGALGRRRSCTITTSTGVDLKTGRLDRTTRRRSRAPARSSATSARPRPARKDWQPSAFSPRTGLLYMPHQNLCMDVEAFEANYIAGTPYVGADVKMYAGPGGHRGEFTAWDPVARRKAWSIKENFPVWSGALVTAGDVVFYGTMDGWFKAVDARPASCSGSSRPAPGSSASRSPTAARTASSTSPSSPASAAGPARSSPATSTRATRTAGARLRQRDEGPAAAHDARADALCLRAAVSARCAALAGRRAGSLARSPSARPTRGRSDARRCASAPIPNNLPFSNERRRGLREPHRRAARRRPRRAAATTPGGRSAAASSARRSAPAAATS